MKKLVSRQNAECRQGASGVGAPGVQPCTSRVKKKAGCMQHPANQNSDKGSDMHRVTAVAEGPQHDRHGEMHSDEMGVRHGQS